MYTYVTKPECLNEEVSIEATWSQVYVHDILAQLYRHGDGYAPDWPRVHETFRDLVGDKTHATYTPENGERLYERMLPRYRLDVEEFRVVAVENTYRKKFTNGHSYMSRPDLVLMRRNDSKDVVVVEHKATTTFNTEPLTCAHNSQILGQLWTTGAREARVNLIQLDKKKLSITQVPLRFTDAQVDAWVAEEASVVEAIEARKESGVWPRTHGACFTYGRKCQFFDLCEGRSNAAASQSR
jgi:hypothetical protein